LLAFRVNTRIEVNAENLRFPAIEYSAFPPPRPCSMPSALNLLPCGRDMETEWVPELMGIVGMSFPQLPLLWDADFLYGPKTVEGNDTYLLCEINVSCVSPFPDAAPVRLARALANHFDVAN
jgi:hypothetical protein